MLNPHVMNELTDIQETLNWITHDPEKLDPADQEDLTNAIFKKIAEIIGALLSCFDNNKFNFETAQEV